MVLRSQLKAIDMKYSREVLSVTRRDRITNYIIWKELGMNSVIQNRMCNSSLVKQIWEAKETGGKVRGRPKKTWNDKILRRSYTDGYQKIDKGQEKMV